MHSWFFSLATMEIWKILVEGKVYFGCNVFKNPARRTSDRSEEKVFLARSLYLQFWSNNHVSVLHLISQYINTTGARICFKELYESKYDPLYIQYMVLSGEVDRFPLSSRVFLKILTFQKVLTIAHAGTGAVDPTL